MSEEEARAFIAQFTDEEKMEIIDEIERLMQSRERVESHLH